MKPIIEVKGLWKEYQRGAQKEKYLSLRGAGNSMVSNANIIKKIYFPRLIIPMSAILVAVFDFFMATGYKQTFLGFAWAVLQPFIMMVILFFMKPSIF